jgi:hypothetical protein
MFARPAAAQFPGCGGEGQSACTAADIEFYANNGYSACQADLKGDGTFFDTLFGEDNCENATRRTLPKDQSWLGWVLREQRYGIGKDEQINWVTTIGTHNSYSSGAQGYGLALGQNQKLSITDQLQAGARILELDPHWYLEHLVLCHGDSNALCYLTAELYSRWFSSGLVEIENWLNANPNEVIMIYLDDGGDNYIQGHEDELYSELAATFGPSIWTVTNTKQISQGHPPTMTQLRKAKKQVILFTETPALENDLVHLWTTNPSYGEFGSNSTDNVDPRIGNCFDGDGHLATQRDQDAFFRIGEGRSYSDLLSVSHASVGSNGLTWTADLVPLVNESQVTSAFNCTASTVELDFLLARDKVPTSQFQQSGPDLRLNAAAWSFTPGDYGNKGPAILQANSWQSTAVEVAGANGNQPVLHYAACSSKSSSAYYADRRAWSVTQFQVPFAFAQAECACESAAAPGSMTSACYATYVPGSAAAANFDHPTNGYENQKLINSIPSGIDGIWLNYKVGSSTLPSLGTAVVNFRFTPGATPKAQTLQISGIPGTSMSFSATPGVGGNYRVVFSPASVTLDQYGGGTVAVSLAGTASLTAGYHGVGAIQAKLAANGQTVGAVLEVNVENALQVSLAANAAQISELGPPAKVVAGVVFGAEGGIGSLTLSEIGNAPVADQPGQVVPTVTLLEEVPIAGGVGPQSHTFSYTGAPGQHTLVASFIAAQDDPRYVTTASNLITLKVGTLMSLSPSAPAFTVTHGGSLPGPQIAMIVGAVGKASASVSADASKWLALSQNGTEIKFNLLSAAAQLPPGLYTGTVFVTSDGIKDSFTVQLNVKGILNPLPSLSLAAINSPVNATTSLTAVDHGDVPFTLRTDSTWLTATADSTFTPANILVTVNPAGLRAGQTYLGSVVVTAKDALNQVKIPVTFSVVRPTEIVSNVATSIEFDGQPIELPAVLALVPGSLHSVAAPQYIPGRTTDTRAAFQSWSDGLGRAHTITAPAASTSAKFGLTYIEQYRLSVQATSNLAATPGGSVNVAPASADGFYNNASQVTLTAMPAVNFAFDHYQGSVQSTKPTVHLSIDAPRQVTAVFKSKLVSSGPAAFSDVSRAQATSRSGPSTPAGRN